MSAIVPVSRPARVRVTLTDGRQATQSVESHRGDFNQPFEEAKVRTKFRDLAAEVLTAEGALAVEIAIDRCDRWDSVGELVALLHRHARK